MSRIIVFFNWTFLGLWRHNWRSQSNMCIPKDLFMETFTMDTSFSSCSSGNPTYSVIFDSGLNLLKNQLTEKSIESHDCRFVKEIPMIGPNLPKA